MADARPLRHEALPPPTRRGLSRVEAAGYIGTSPSTFDKLVAGGLMPKPKRVLGRVIWDARALDRAFDALPGDGDSADGDSPEPNEWD
jgi:predicted DNA-binding transcriptional regulator AlpA